jgi:hypothetical protein
VHDDLELLAGCELEGAANVGRDDNLILGGELYGGHESLGDADNVT